MELKQVFIKCHDNDFWSYYRGALYTLYYWYSYTHRDWQEIDTQAIQEFVEESLNSIYKLSNRDSERKTFPWKVIVTINEDAKIAYEKEAQWGNSECAYMDIETYLMTPKAQIEDFIFNV